MPKTMPTTKAYEKAFTEWDRRYREDPERFDSDMMRITRGQTMMEYGEACASYFEELLAATSTVKRAVSKPKAPRAR